MPINISKQTLASPSGITQHLWLVPVLLTPPNILELCSPWEELPFPQTLISVWPQPLWLFLLLVTMLSWPLGLLALFIFMYYLYSFLPSLSPCHGCGGTNGLLQSGPFQMPLAVLFLLSTIKSFSSAITRSTNVLIFIQTGSYLTALAYVKTNFMWYSRLWMTS